MPKRAKSKSIKNDDTVTAYRYGDSLELTNAPVTAGQSIVKLTDTEYIVLATGEVKEYKHDNDGTRASNLASVQRTMKWLRRLIGYNFQGGSDQLWITLTYAINQRDTSAVYYDFKHLMRKLRRAYGDMEYLCVVEPQVRGAYHMHVLLKTVNGEPLYIDNIDLYRLWGKGFTKVKRLRESDNVGAYLMAYLGDVDMNNLDGDLVADQHKKKAISKGARLYLYQAGMNIYRRSKGILEPPKIRATKSDVLRDNGLDVGDRPDYYREVSVPRDANGDIVIAKEYYNVKKHVEKYTERNEQHGSNSNC